MIEFARTRGALASFPVLDRPLLPLRLARARSNGWFVGASAVEETVGTELIDLGYPAADAAWNGLGQAADGRLYCAAGTHSLDSGARLFATAPGSSRADALADLDKVLPSKRSEAIPQGKVHVEMPAFADGVLGATHVGYYGPQPPMRAYPGGWFFCAGPRGVQPLAQAPAGEGIISMTLDQRRSVAFALSWPRGLLLELDLGARSLRNHGPVHGAGEVGSLADRARGRICRSLGVDLRTGAVYWSDSQGRVFCRAQGGIEQVALLPRRSLWRKLAWHPAEGVFYGLMWSGGELFRFDPAALDIQQLGPLRLPGASRGVPTSLGFVLDAERNRIHLLAVGPGVRRPREAQLPSTVAYLTHDLGSGATVVHGSLRSRDGRWLTRAESLLLSPPHAYSVCWVEVPRRDRSARAQELRRLRRHSFESRFRGYVEEVVLARFQAR